VASKLSETDAAQAGSNYNRYSITSVPAFNATPGASLRLLMTVDETLHPAVVD